VHVGNPSVLGVPSHLEGPSEKESFNVVLGILSCVVWLQGCKEGSGPYMVESRHYVSAQKSGPVALENLSFGGTDYNHH